jgi:G3E family GTPase
MTPLILIVGFLGAGKTTFLQNLLPALASEGLSPSLLTNDYQNARIDAERFRGAIDEITALNGDCVCCGARDELLAALERFEHLNGRVLLIETNGTTDSEQLLETLAFNKNLKRFTPPIQLSIIDGQRWQHRFWHNALERDQVRTATHLFISRSDIIAPERLASVKKSLAALDIQAPMSEPASFAREIALLPETIEPLGRRPHHPQYHEIDHLHAKHHFASCEIPLPALLPKRAFENLLDSLPKEVLRAKGLAALREDPGEFQIFQKVGPDGPAHFHPIGRHPWIDAPVALFIGPQLPIEVLKTRIDELKKRFFWGGTNFGLPKNYRRRGSNPHSRGNAILSRARLPIPPRRLEKKTKMPARARQ